MRRRLIVAAAAFAVAIALPVAAQDARATAVQSAARDWLALVDQGDAAASYAATGPKFGTAISSERWADALPASAKTFGDLVQRAVVTTQFSPTLSGQPDGDYARIAFRSSYARKPVAQELLTLERIDGRWRVIAYIIK